VEGKFVIPGEQLGISEEFMPGRWTYEEQGGIYAAVSGMVAIDMKDRRINVLPKANTPPLLKEGDVVLAKILDVKPQIALVEVIKLRGVDRALPGVVKGIIHVSKARERYVADLSTEFGFGDIVMARVVSTKREPLELSTAGKRLGVIKAFCPRCGKAMERFKQGLRCRGCRIMERRKLSMDYGSGEV